MNQASSGKKVVLNSIVYSCSGLLIKCFSFFLLPLYTAYLTTADYGITSVASSFISTMGFIVAFSLFSAVMRFYVDLNDDPEKMRRFYGTVVIFVTLSGIGFGLVLTAFRGLLSKYVFSGIDYYPVILICLVSVLFSCLHTVFDNILRSQQRAMKSSVLSIAFFFITLALNITFVVWLRMGAIGSLLASLIGYVVYAVYFVIDMLRTRQIKFCLDKGLLKSALKYSIPIMPHNLSTQIAMLVSKVLIGGSNSLSVLGVYSVASQFGNMADTVQCYVDQAYGPWLYEKLHSREEGFKASIRSISKLLAAAIGFFFIGISLFSQDYILLFLKEEYYDAWRYVPLIVLVFAIKTMYYFYVGVLFYHKEASRWLFTATLSGSLVNVVLSYFIIPIWGAYGSILADAVAMALRVLVIVCISRHFEKIGLRVSDFLLNSVLVTLFVFGGLALSYFKYPYTFSVLNFMYKVAVVCLYIVVACLMNRKELCAQLQTLKSKKRKS